MEIMECEERDRLFYFTYTPFADNVFADIEDVIE